MVLLSVEVGDLQQIELNYASRNVAIAICKCKLITGFLMVIGKTEVKIAVDFTVLVICTLLLHRANLPGFPLPTAVFAIFLPWDSVLGNFVEIVKNLRCTDVSVSYITLLS